MMAGLPVGQAKVRRRLEHGGAVARLARSGSVLDGQGGAEQHFVARRDDMLRRTHL